MIYGIFVFFHLVACVVLIAVILLQSGRGGGLSEMAGGQGAQQTQKLFGTQTNSLLMKFTSYCAIAFLITSISLVLLTSQKSKSLMEGARIQPIFNTDAPMTGKDGKPLDKKSLEDAIKALAEAAKKSQAEAGKTAQTAEAEAVKAADAVQAEGAKMVETVKAEASAAAAKVETSAQTVKN